MTNRQTNQANKLSNNWQTHRLTERLTKLPYDWQISQHNPPPRNQQTDLPTNRAADRPTDQLSSQSDKRSFGPTTSQSASHKTLSHTMKPVSKDKQVTAIYWNSNYLPRESYGEYKWGKTQFFCVKVACTYSNHTIVTENIYSCFIFTVKY